MQLHVLAMIRAQLEIGDSVVVADAIFMMHNFDACEIPSQVALHNQSVFSDVAITIASRMRWCFYSDVSLVCPALHGKGLR